MRINRTLTILFAIISLTYGCSRSNSTSKINFAYKYDPEPSIIRPDFKLFHLSDQLSNFYFGINAKEVLYTKVYGDTTYEAHLKIRYKLYLQSDTKTLIDSATYQMRDTTVEGQFGKSLLGGFTIKATNGNDYFIEIRIRDEHRDLNTVEFFNFKKSQAVTNGHFLLLDSNNYPLLNDQIIENNPFKIVRSPWLKNTAFQLNFYESPFGMAPPPFSENGINYSLPEPISSEQVILLDTTFVAAKQKGFYSISDVQSPNSFYTFLAVEEEYPIISDVEQLLQPTRFISTQKEYDKLLSSPNPKEGVDEFWLNITKDFNRAKQILGTYYGRVESSNRFFTDVQEGWRTDRGLIYLIYGAPSTIYKGFNYEKWIYGEETNMLAISFNFTRIETPVSTNIYILERNPTYKSSWYKAVDNWRQGRVY